MEKHNKDVENVKVERDSLQATLIQTYVNYWKLKLEKDSLQATLIQTYVNYWKLKLEKDSLSVEHNKLDVLQEYGVDYFKAAKRVKGVQRRYW